MDKSDLMQLTHNTFLGISVVCSDKGNQPVRILTNPKALG